jgi:hypothetical protein
VPAVAGLSGSRAERPVLASTIPLGWRVQEKRRHWLGGTSPGECRRSAAIGWAALLLPIWSGPLPSYRSRVCSTGPSSN